MLYYNKLCVVRGNLITEFDKYIFNHDLQKGEDFASIDENKLHNVVLQNI